MATNPAPNEVKRPASHQADSCDKSVLAHRYQDDRTVHEQPLDEHLQATANLAAKFAEPFDASELASLIGLWHDLGKYSRQFQRYIRGVEGNAAHIEVENRPSRVDHSTTGATFATKCFTTNNALVGQIAAFCIAGHHAGLADWDNGGNASLVRRLAKDKPETLDAFDRIPPTLRNLSPPPLPMLAPGADDAEIAFQTGLFVRLLFSCLTDADFLDTEQFMSPARGQDRQATRLTLTDIAAALDSHLAEKQAQAKNTKVNRHRRAVLKACREAAQREPGFFSLTVPTGGGKTLSSLAFALAHAENFNKRRIVYAIPFTSIIEQNAAVFREALSDLGPAAVLEHHCNMEPRRETPWSRLACENWDAPLIVTTNVQLFESLFAARGSQCRKLHRLVNSVIILDEAQTIPVDLLQPCLAVLRELVRNYGCSIVLCTATQPAVQQRVDFSLGLENVREIIPNPKSLYQQMRRVEVTHLGQCDDDELARRLNDEPQALCIVNSKKHAVELFRRLLPTDEAFHLSTNMCPRHRTAVLRLVKQRLRCGKPCRLVSTSLIEAGVDIDVPVVYRAAAGIDAIAQAAGRCNREGRQKSGRVHVFDAEHPPPPGHLRQTADTAAELIGRCDDLLAPETVEQYFRLHYWKKQDSWDRHGVMQCFKPSPTNLLCDFRTAAERFRMIPQKMRPVLIPYGRRGRRYIKQLEASGHGNRNILRQLQRYTAQVSEGTFRQLESRGLLGWLHEQFPVLLESDAYRSDIGVSSGDGSLEDFNVL